MIKNELFPENYNFGLYWELLSGINRSILGLYEDDCELNLMNEIIFTNGINFRELSIDLNDALYNEL